MHKITVINILYSLIMTTKCLPRPFNTHGTHGNLIEPRIINANSVDIRETPYFAALQRRSWSGWEQHCGASILASHSVVTAAHCVIRYENDITQLRVTVGTSYRFMYGTNYYLQRIIIHEDFNARTMENDIAVLIVNNLIRLGPTVAYLLVPTANIIPPSGTEALVTGFGMTSNDGTMSPTLSAAKVYIVDQSDCKRAYQDTAVITDGMICAGASDPPRDACKGDSGGPLVVNNVLVGIVSWGRKCADPMYPGIYTRVSKYISWLFSVEPNLKNGGNFASIYPLDSPNLMNRPPFAAVNPIDAINESNLSPYAARYPLNGRKPYCCDIYYPQQGMEFEYRSRNSGFEMRPAHRSIW